MSAPAARKVSHLDLNLGAYANLSMRFDAWMLMNCLARLFVSLQSIHRRDLQELRRSLHNSPMNAEARQFNCQQRMEYLAISIQRGSYELSYSRLPSLDF
jgi:hypothetical protein